MAVVDNRTNHILCVRFAYHQRNILSEKNIWVTDLSKTHNYNGLTIKFVFLQIF